MLLPLTLVRNLQMSFVKKISLSILFSLAGFVMIAATIRAVQISERSARPLPTWSALWSIIEASVGKLHQIEPDANLPLILTLLIAMIVGCGPGLYCKANELHQSRQRSDKSGNLTDNSLQAQHSSVQPSEPVVGDVPLRRFPTTTLVKAANRSDSQEELVGSNDSARITIKKSFEVDRTRNEAHWGEAQTGDNALASLPPP